MKKSSISIETIIKFVLVLAVAGVLLFLLSEKFSLFKQSNSCEERGGICTDKCEDRIISLLGCDKEKKEVCCMGIG